MGDTVVTPVKTFAKDSVRLINKCTKPDRKEYTKVALRTVMGFLIMGFIGFFVKLICMYTSTARRCPLTIAHFRVRTQYESMNIHSRGCLVLTKILMCAVVVSNALPRARMCSLYFLPRCALVVIPINQIILGT